MITISFKECCRWCARAKPYMLNSKDHEDPSDWFHPCIRIGCDHEHSCKQYEECDLR